MESEIHIGDLVDLLKLPEGLLDGLPIDEQEAILSFVGKSVTVSRAEKDIKYWFEFTVAVPHEGGLGYMYHEFSVTPDCIRKVV